LATTGPRENSDEPRSPYKILHPWILSEKTEKVGSGRRTPPTCFASPALQADAEVVAAALASPFYAEPPPPVPPSCVLRFAAEELTLSCDAAHPSKARPPG
jgi:hypothetical protein